MNKEQGTKRALKDLKELTQKLDDLDISPQTIISVGVIFFLGLLDKNAPTRKDYLRTLSMGLTPIDSEKEQDSE